MVYLPTGSPDLILILGCISLRSKCFQSSYWTRVRAGGIFFFFFALVPTFSTNSRGIAGLRLHDLKLLVLEISHFILVLYGELQDTIVVSKLNKPPLSNKPPVSIKTPPPSPLNGLEISKPPGGLSRGFTVL